MSRKTRRHRSRSKKSFKLKLKTQTYYSIVQLIFFSLSILIMISFIRNGIILTSINNFIVGNFGWTSYLIPFIFLSFGFLVSRFKVPLAQPNVIVGAILLLFSLAGLTSTGKLGRSSWDGISTLATPIGALIILCFSLMVAIVVMFNTSLDHVYKVLARLFQQYIVRGEQKAGKINPSLPRKEMKVIGDGPNLSVSGSNRPFSISGGTSKNEDRETVKSDIKQPLEEKLVSNLPGEEKIWKYPSLDILSDSSSGKADRGDIKGNAANIEQTLESFGITAHVVEVNLGPAVTQYALEVALGTKLSKITALERDLALSLAAPTGTIRIEAPIPGRSLVGIELPNRAPEFVTLKKIMVSPEMGGNKNKLAVALGLDVSGKPVVGNIGKMPHVLIAGQTGSGKSVGINTFICSMLLRASPAEVKLILVDPKRVELTNYNNIPHLLSPVIVEPDKVISALRWLMSEMDRRYKLFAQAGVRNIDSYNEMSGFQALPYIVLFIDELADIMLFSPVEVEDAITRIAQMARATGIHMILATQRPSVDVITGLIKANIPCRIAFAVSSQVDSRVILDGQGAEKLLGRGDMLYLAPDQAKPTRIQMAYISDKDINALVSYLKNQGVEPQYTEEVTSMPKPGTTVVDGVDGEMDEFFKQAVEVVCQYDRASASLLQRRLSVGYARAARIMDQLEKAGVIGPADGSKPREVLIQGMEQLFGESSQKESGN